MSDLRLTMMDTEPGSECIVSTGDKTYHGIVQRVETKDDGTMVAYIGARFFQGDWYVYYGED